VQIQEPGGWGSGTIVDADKGLILTNAHVAAPDAMGNGVRNLAMVDELDKAPATFTINVTSGTDKAAEPRFIGETVVADGYLDLAVIKITKTVGGDKVDAGDLGTLTQVPLGDSDAMKSGAAITIIGYPGAARSVAPTVTTGVISGVQRDIRLGTDRAWLNTDAASAHRNSGGLAANDSGELIGIPSLGLKDLQSDQYAFSGLRPVEFAVPLIEAARAGKTYTSPWTQPAPSGFTADLVKAAPQEKGSITSECGSGSTPGVASAGLTYTLRIDPGLTAGGQDIDVLVELRADGEVAAKAFTPYPTALNKKGCMTVTFFPLNSETLPGGRYVLVVGLGGNYTPVYTTSITW
jgi:S1-C subfamily serine protease